MKMIIDIIKNDGGVTINIESEATTTPIEITIGNYIRSELLGFITGEVIDVFKKSFIEAVKNGETK